MLRTDFIGAGPETLQPHLKVLRHGLWKDASSPTYIVAERGSRLPDA